jgi:hypothetical protein
VADADIADPDRLKRLPTPTPLRVRRWAGFPEALPPLIGREHDVSRLSDRLRRYDTRLITLVGTGGVGKTRLAIATAKACTGDFALRQPARLSPTRTQAPSQIVDERLSQLYDGDIQTMPRAPRA